MPNPFEDESSHYIVLRNHEGQHSIWPEGLTVPLGWNNAYGPARRTDCLDFVQKNWLDMKPLSLMSTRSS